MIIRCDACRKRVKNKPVAFFGKIYSLFALCNLVRVCPTRLLILSTQTYQPTPCPTDTILVLHSLGKPN